MTSAHDAYPKRLRDRARILSLFVAASALAACSVASVEASPGDPAGGEANPSSADPAAADGGSETGRPDEAGPQDKPVSLPSGTVDPAYGTGGLVASESSGHHFATALAPSGRAAYAPTETNRFVRLHVLTPDGKPDATASGPAGGIEITAADNTSEALSFAMKLADDGTVMLYGSLRRAGAPAAFVARIKNGALNPSFGTGGIRIFTEYYARTAGMADARDGTGAVVGRFVLLSLDPVGSLAPGGERAAQTRLYKLTTAGAIDTTFGTAGWTQAPPGARLLQDLDGRLRLLHASSTLPTSNFYLDEVTSQRVTAQGAVDTTYGVGGKATASVTPFSYWSWLPLRNGDTLVHFDKDARRVQRLTPTGAVSNAFPSIAAVSLSLFSTFAAEEADGKLLLASNNEGAADTWKLTRWTAAGAVDATFANAGVLTAPRAKENMVAVRPLASGAYMVIAEHHPKTSEYSVAVRRIAK